VSGYPGMDGPVREMRTHSPDATLCANPECRVSFYKRVKWQRYCGDTCRVADHKDKSGPAGIRGALHDMRPLKGGKWSVIVHVDAVEAAALMKLGKGQLVGIVE
jgi:hypothetical protein